jgi:hypothetical protein
MQDPIIAKTKNNKFDERKDDDDPPLLLLELLRTSLIFFRALAPIIVEICFVVSMID